VALAVLVSVSLLCIIASTIYVAYSISIAMSNMTVAIRVPVVIVLAAIQAGWLLILLDVAISRVSPSKGQVVLSLEHDHFNVALTVANYSVHSTR